MPTVVDLPQVQQVDTSGSQPLYNGSTADHSGNFLNFMMGVAQGVKQTQDKNKDADQALGEIDAVNGVTRDVGILHQQNYNAGQQYGALVQDHVKKDAQFKQSVSELLQNNPDATPDDIAQLATSISQDEVATVYNNSNNIKDKSILSDMYKQIPKFYAARLVAGQKAIQAAAGQRLDNIRNTNLADFMGFLNQDTLDAANLENQYSTTYTSLKNAYVSSGKSQVEASNAAESDLLSAVKTIQDIAKLNPTSQQAVSWANNTKTLLGSVLRSPDISPDFKGKLANIVDDVQTKVQSENGAMTDIQTSQFNLNKLSNPKTMETDVGQVNAYIGQLTQDYQSGKISATTLASNISKVTSAYSEFTGKKISMKPLPAQLGDMPFKQAQHDYGTSASEWSDARLELFNDQYKGDLSTAAYRAIGFAISGDSYMPELVQKAGLQAYREFGGALKMSPPQFAALGDQAQYKADQYYKFKSVYADAVKQGSPVADDLLSMLPDDVREAVRENIVTGGTLGDLQTKLSNPIEYKTKSANFDSQVSNPDYKKMGLDKYWHGSSQASSGKFWGNKPSDTNIMKQALAQAYTMVYKNDKSSYVDSATTNLADNVIPNMLSKGSLIQSPEGYSSVGMNIAKMQTIGKVLGSGGDTNYVVGHTLDLYREQYAAKFHTNAKNVVAYSTGYGAKGNIAFDVYNKDGTGLLARASVDMHSLINQAQKNYTAFKQGIQANSAVHQPTGFDGTGSVGTPVTYNKNGYFMNNATVRDGFSGKSYQVNLPNTMTIPYNGNTDLAKAAIDHLNLWEGWHSGIQQVRGANTYTVAQQVLVVDAQGRKTKYYDMAANAKSQQDLANIQGLYMKDNMRALQPAARQIGIPVATTNMYPENYKQFQMLLTDPLWLGGGKGLNQMVNVLRSNTDAVVAVGQLKSTNYWKAMQPQRRIWVAKTIANYMYMKRQGMIRY